VSPAGVVEVFVAVKVALDSDGGKTLVDCLFQGAGLDDNGTFLENFHQRLNSGNVSEDGFSPKLMTLAKGGLVRRDGSPVFREEVVG